jgi:hypothetical protein
MMKKFAIGLLSVLFLACAGPRNLHKDRSVRFNDHKIQYEGRVALKTDAAEFYWPGTSATIRFKGTGASVTVSDYNGQNYLDVIVDGIYSGKLKIDSTLKEYTLAHHLPFGEHEVTIFKATQINREFKRGYTSFYKFTVKGDILPPKPSMRKSIEFYGNSITCGHAVEDSSGKDSGAPAFENNYFSYAAITARHFNAHYSCIAVSGIGLFSGYRTFTMPEIYDLRNPFENSDKWNFSLFQPDVVVVNLLQNDEGVITRPASDQFKKLFGTTPPNETFIVEKYAGFIKKLRIRYPKASIICVLGDMAITKPGSVWPGYVKKAVASLNDRKVYSYFFRYKGTPGHPNVKEQQDMADELIGFIRARSLL